MKVSELIGQLQGILDERGDLPVTVWTHKYSEYLDGVWSGAEAMLINSDGRPLYVEDMDEEERAELDEADVGQVVLIS